MGKIIKNVILVLLFFTLGISIAFLVYVHFFASDGETLSGEWTAEVDMTKQAAFTAYDWLQDIEAVSVSLEEMESYMQGLTIEVNLTLEQTDRAEGNFQCRIVPESYDTCNQAAYEAFAAAFQDILVQRLHMAGYTDSTDEEDIEALVTETFGMSTVPYLMSYAPALLPTLEDLQAQYDGSGTYEAEQSILTRRFDVDGAVITRAEYYIRKDSNLILAEEINSVFDGSFWDYYPVKYTLKNPQN